MKQKLIYLFSLMLLSILGTSGALAETVTATWSWQDATPSSITASTTEGADASGSIASDVAGISLDYLAAESGAYVKLQYNASGYAQFNVNTAIRVPVISTSDVVTVVSYPGQYNYTVGGTAATANETQHTATKSEVKAGYVEIVATSTAYLYSISVVQDEDAAAASAAGETISCSALVPSGHTESTFNETTGITTGQTNCTLLWSGLQAGSNKVTVDDVDYYKMGGSSAYVQLILTSGKFQAGDIVSATVAGNGAGSVVLSLKSDGGNKFDEGTVSAGGTTTITKTLVAADIEDDGSIKIYRAGNTRVRVAAFSVTGTRNNDLTESDLTVTSSTSFSLAIGNSSTITYTTSSDGDISFTSGNDAVATVSDAGVITAVSGGTTSVSILQEATDTYDEGSASVTVVVPYDLVSANEYTLGSSTYGFSDSSSNYYFTNGFSMSNSGGKGWGAGSLSGTGKYSAGVTYTINIPEGVTVSSATITGRSNYNTTQYAYWGELFGEDYSDEQLPQSDETAAEKTITFDGGATGTLTFKPKGNQVLFKIVLNADNREESDLAITSDASVSLDDVTTTSQITYTTSADVSSISYTSSNVKVATVSSTGLITAVANGTCTITVSQKGDANFKDDSKVVTVTVNNGVIASINISAIVNNQTGTLITASEISNKSEVSFGVNENSERVEADASDAILIVNGKYHSDHGLENVSFTVGVPGNVKISVGECTYSGGKITVKNSENEIVATKTPIKDCWKNDNTKVAVLYYEGNATTLTISGMSYCPYIAVESVDEVPATFTSQFYNGSTLVSTVETYEGTTLDVPAAPSTESGEVFIGWYTATDGTGTKATSATVPTADGIYYANILPITFTNDYLVVDNSGTDRKNGEHFLAALEYANANSTQTNPVKIFIPNGTYDFGNVAGTTISGSYISFIGESMDGVVILTTPEEEGLSKADLLYNRGAHNYFQNLTLKNNYPYGNTTGRAAAFHDQGSFTIFKDCYLNSHQDTYYSHQVGKYFYFEGGKISGCVDYMCGNGKVFYEGVTLVNDNRSTYMTANSELYVYNNCVVENGGSTYYFGRSWDGYPTCIFLNTTLKDNGAKLGSTRWVEAGMNTIYGRAGEYGTKNAEGTDITPESNVITFTKGTTSLVQNTILTAEEAETYSYENFFSSANWDPASVAAQATVVKSSVVDNVVNVPEGIYLVEKDGEFVELFNGTSYTFDNSGEYTLRMANARGGFGEAVAILEPETIVVDETGVATYVTKQALDFTDVTEFDAYAVTEVKTSSVATEKVTEVPSGTALLIKANGAVSVDVPAIAGADAITNLLLASDGSVVSDGSTIFAYSKSKKKFAKVKEGVTIPEGKAYLEIVGSSTDAFDVDFDGEATAINGVAEDEAEVAPVKVIKDGQLFIGNYNVAGQLVK